MDKCLPRATAPNNPLSLIPAAPSQLYKLLTSHPVNPAAERPVKLHPPSKQRSKLPSLYNMMGAKNSHFPLQASQIESYPVWRRGAPTRHPLPLFSLNRAFISNQWDWVERADLGDGILAGFKAPIPQPVSPVGRLHYPSDEPAVRYRG